ncbi:MULTISPECIES: hypothetical protein [Capnocytophaga]|nr:MULTISPECIES: hypothetical protein [unclassified Capnocytophaga]KHE67810.1 hypothetical protein HMPREF9074_09489 [Capnocytophaga sp. oral taxon 329 str. F0087]QGS17486.1 hypothetical protein FOC45_04115 [Capnocytophaga sp. FDAARGOS_737]
MKNIRNFAGRTSGSASRTGRDVGRVGQVRQVGRVRVRAAWTEKWDK